MYQRSARLTLSLFALAGFTQASQVVVPAGSTIRLTAPLVVDGSGNSLTCAPGSSIVKEFEGDAIQITGDNILVDGCRLDGNSGRYGGGLLVITGARGVNIHNTTLTGSAGVAVFISNSSDITITNSTFSGNRGSPIFAQDGLERIEITNNTIDSSSASPPTGIDTIGVHTYMPGGIANTIRIHDNTIIHGGDNFAIEVGAFGPGAAPPQDVIVRNNIIKLVRDSNGAVSYSTLNHGSITGNPIDAGGHLIRIGAVELVTTTDVLVENNTLTGVPPSTTYTVSINGGSRNTFRNNRFQGGIYVGTSRQESPNVDDNIIEQNTLTAMPQANLPRGLIWFQCNTFQCSVSRNIVRNNVLQGNNSGPAVLFENDYWEHGAQVDSNQAVSNQIIGVTDRVGIGPHVTKTSVY